VIDERREFKRTLRYLVTLDMERGTDDSRRIVCKSRWWRS